MDAAELQVKRNPQSGLRADEQACVDAWSAAYRRRSAAGKENRDGETDEEIAKALDEAWLEDSAEAEAGIREGHAKSRSDSLTPPSKGTPSGSASARNVRGGNEKPKG